MIAVQIYQTPTHSSHPTFTLHISKPNTHNAPISTYSCRANISNPKTFKAFISSDFHFADISNPKHIKHLSRRNSPNRQRTSQTTLVTHISNSRHRKPKTQALSRHSFWHICFIRLTSCKASISAGNIAFKFQLLEGSLVLYKVTPSNTSNPKLKRLSQQTLTV